MGFRPWPEPDQNGIKRPAPISAQAQPSTMTKRMASSIRIGEWRSVTTIEGLSPDRNHAVQQAFVAEQAIQCGFCTPGLVMSAAALLARNVNPTEADILAAITNICRCGVQPRLVRTIQRAGRILRGEEPGLRVPVPANATTPGL